MDNINFDAIYDLTLATPNLNTKKFPYEQYPLYDMFTKRKYPPQVHLHCRRILKAQIPKDVDNWLYQIFYEKDDMLQEYVRSGQLKHPLDKEYTAIPYEPAFQTFPIQIGYLWCVMLLLVGIYFAK